MLRDGIRAEMKQENGRSILESDRELFIDFRKDFKNGELLIDIKNKRDKNQLEKGRKVKAPDAQHMNVINIMVNMVSRPAFHRMYPKTKNFLRKYSWTQKKSKSVYEFFRAHSLKGYYFPDVYASLYGAKYETSYLKHEFKRIDAYAREAGYITGLATDSCNLGIEDLARNI